MDFFVEWNNDFVLTPNGSIQTAIGWDQVRQRIMRRLITNAQARLPDGSTTPPDYIFDRAYGIGLGARVDQIMTQEGKRDLERRIVTAVRQDSAVDTTQQPAIRFRSPQPNTLVINIAVKLKNGQTGALAFQLS